MTENRGGTREGAGRKAIFELGEAKRKEILRDVAAVAEKKGTSLGRELGEMMFGRGKDKRVKMQAMQLYCRDILPKVSEREVAVSKIRGPAIYLPEQRPSLQSIEGGKK
jgi:hypothetical protein